MELSFEHSPFLFMFVIGLALVGLIQSLVSISVTLIWSYAIISDSTVEQWLKQGSSTQTNQGTLTSGRTN